MAVDARHVGVVGVVDVAVGAYRRVMGQSPVLAVIESRVGPRSGVVAGGAGCREPGGNVIRHVAAQRDRTLPGSLMAAVTIRREIARIVAVDMAGGTRRRDMSASEGKACRGVVKLPGGPGRDRMARRAHGRGSGEAGCDVVGNGAADGGRAVPCSGVAAHAICRVERVIVIDVTRSAGSRRGRHMCAHQSEAGHTVVERSSVPAGGGVARGAICNGKCRTRR